MTLDELRHLHRQPSVIALWCRVFGPLLRWLTPLRRRVLLSLGAIVAAARYPFDHAQPLVLDPLALSLLGLLLFAFVLLCYAAAKNFARLPAPVRRHPQISLHSILWLLLIVLWMAKPRQPLVATLLAGAVITLPYVLWRVGYMMFTAQRGKMGGTRLRDHLFYIFPVWGGSDTPYGKGFDYLSAHEARDEAALARSQLSGLKLFLLAGILTLLKAFFLAVVFKRIPLSPDMLANPRAYTLGQRWLGLYAELFWSVITLAINGHIIIGWLRFFGFDVFRNTYKPLLAETIVAFWNRYYYYFKELLVNFFFLPTFARYFKKSPRLRLIAAVFMAAFVGNMYYHWLALDEPLATGDFPAMWTTLQSRFFYCFLLATGLCISMFREQQRGKMNIPRAWPARTGAIFLVWTFFSLIDIWQEKAPVSFAQRCAFFLGLFGLA